MAVHTQELAGGEVIASGSFVFGQGESEGAVRIDNLKFVFSFVEASGEASVAAVEADKSTLKFVLTGWNNPLTTTYGAENIATLGGRTLNMRIAVVSVGEAKEGGLLNGPIAPPRVLNYMIFTKRAA